MRQVNIFFSASMGSQHMTQEVSSKSFMSSEPPSAWEVACYFALVFNLGDYK